MTVSLLPMTEAEMQLTPAALAEIRETLKKNIALIGTLVQTPMNVQSKILFDPFTAQAMCALALVRVEELLLLTAGADGGANESRRH